MINPALHQDMTCSLGTDIYVRDGNNEVFRDINTEASQVSPITAKKIQNCCIIAYRDSRQYHVFAGVPNKRLC